MKINIRQERKKTNGHQIQFIRLGLRRSFFDIQSCPLLHRRRLIDIHMSLLQLLVHPSKRMMVSFH